MTKENARALGELHVLEVENVWLLRSKWIESYCGVWMHFLYKVIGHDLIEKMFKKVHGKKVYPNLGLVFVANQPLLKCSRKCSRKFMACVVLFDGAFMSFLFYFFVESAFMSSIVPLFPKSHRKSSWWPVIKWSEQQSLSRFQLNL